MLSVDSKPAANSINIAYRLRYYAFTKPEQTRDWAGQLRRREQAGEAYSSL